MSGSLSGVNNEPQSRAPSDVTSYKRMRSSCVEKVDGGSAGAVRIIRLHVELGFKPANVNKIRDMSSTHEQTSPSH